MEDIHNLMQPPIFIKETNDRICSGNHHAGFLEESLGIAFDSADLGYFYVDVIDRKIFVKNTRFKQLFGYIPSDHFTYHDAIDRIHPDYRRVVYEAIEAAMVEGIRFDMEFPITGSCDEHSRWVHGIGSIHHDKKRINNSYFIAFFYETTEKKRNEIRKNDFIIMVSHELKSPLSALSAILQTVALKLKRSNDDYVREAFLKSMSQITKMTNLIDGFLEIPRLDAGKLRLDKSDFDISELIQEQIRETELSISTHSIQFSACDPLFLNADYNKIGYVISNLIRNAIKYSLPGKLIKINCHLADNVVQISVSDEGIGIEPRDKEKLFERYYRAENSFTRHTGGSGIGLYLCAEIIQRHEGKIWVNSQPGVGSIFHFSLPTQITD
ncbi:PAS domain-containing sensor histidine kinase [Mucilaginibacter sabulilitoris]|uniref:histidine kinase n=1 Tax=Mucilaginibacter sabulilitoris TaxID=1173583 RepID=A0ABZ0TVS5_9SPHI|nr:PAS domain-containing sensor histidine kinase [Mucilaginibacter sabulilitoris]WPU96972.1 PAS domain-containing sensor histidine kinase [Mucilaginibacter sabulilitoris]